MDDSATARTRPRIHTAPRTDISQDQGKFRAHFAFPGRTLPDHADHGYGPLAAVVESFMDPGTLIRMHQHRNEEIVSWVPAGVMRHDDREGNELVTDAGHLLVMNAGSGFWHAEETLADDPPLRMLQIFVRPHSLDLEPNVQHGPIPDPVPGEWRHLFGPEDGDAPLYVRNDVDCYDCRLAAGERVGLPGRSGRGTSGSDRDTSRSGRETHRSDWETYLYVFEGSVTVAERAEANGDDASGAGEDEGESAAVGFTESALVTGGGDVEVTAEEDSILVAFRLDPDATITRRGTIGR